MPIPTTAAQRTALTQLAAAHATHSRTLIDSVGLAADVTAGARRIRELLARQRRECYAAYIAQTPSLQADERTLTVAHRTALAQLATIHTAHQRVLPDSLGSDVDVATGTQRVLQMLARQAGERRASLRSQQQAVFDEEARRWQQVYKVFIPGVPS